MKKTVATLISLLALSCALSNAQKFNPRVEVENDYEGKVIEAVKNPVEMAAPDTLYKFRYTLDYSVFENPYAGSYDFHPYKIEMKPEAQVATRKKFYASVGAGFTVHPELDLVYSPQFKNKRFTFSVYDRLRGYWGPYAVPSYTTSANIYETRYDVARRSGRTVDGWGFAYDNKLGFDFRYEFRRLAVEMDAGYRLLTSDDTLTSHFMNLAEAEIRLLPIDPEKANNFYGARFYVNAGADQFYSLMSRAHRMGVNDMGADAGFGFPLGRAAKLTFWTGIQTIVYSGYRDAAATKAWITPQVHLAWKGGDADLGVKVSYLKGTSLSSDYSTSFYNHKSNIIYPAVKIRQQLVPGHLSLYLKAEGGDYLNCYTDYLASNPFFNPAMLLDYLNSSSVRVKATAGLSGSIAGKLQFDLHGGYAMYDNWMSDAAQIVSSPAGTYFTSYANYIDYTMFFGDLSLLWQSPRVDADLHVLYRYTNDFFNEGALAVEPAALSGEFKFTCNWNRQAFLGLDVAAQSARRGYMVIGENFDRYAQIHIAPWVDLGVHASYAFNPKFSVWVKSGNLLGHHVYKYFLHPEKGPWATVGVTFNF